MQDEYLTYYLVPTRQIKSFQDWEDSYKSFEELPKGIIKLDSLYGISFKGFKFSK